MTIRLTNATIQPAPEGAHPGFRQGASRELDHHAGFGPGDHYTLEVQTPERMRVLPGITTVVWYCAPATDGGWTAAAIEAAEGLPSGTVTAAWVSGQSNTTYGLRSDLPLAIDEYESIGRILRRWVEANANGTSPWFMFKSGNNYGDFLEYWEGEDALHPALVSSYGAGNRPLFTASSDTHIFRDPPPNNLVIQGIEFTHQQSSNIGNGHKNWIYSDCHFDTDKHGLTMSQFARITMYACSVIDCTYDSPTNGNNWGGERGSGIFMARFESKLTWGCFFDRNGWKESYNQDGATWNDGQYGQPPHFFNHNDYTQKDSSDVTYLMNINARAPFSADQARSGGFANVNVRVENNAGGNFGDGVIDLILLDRSGDFSAAKKVRGQTSGRTYKVAVGNGFEFGLIRLSPLLAAGNTEPFNNNEIVEGLDDNDLPVGATGRYVDYANSIRPRGNFTYVSHMLTMGAGYKDSAINIGQRDKAQNGLPSVPYTARYMRAANGVDPQNPAEATAKSGFETTTTSGLSDADMANAFLADVKIHNWGAGSNDRNVSGLDQTALDAVTLGGWYDSQRSVAIGTSTTVDALSYLRTLRSPGLQSTEIWNHAAPAFGDPAIGHSPGALATFEPDPAGDGFRMDGINNWSVNGQSDYPVDGDNCALNDNFAYNFMTWRFSDLNFGAIGTGGIRMYGGFVSCTSAQGDGCIELRESGQFYFAGTFDATVDVSAKGGRLGFLGTALVGNINVELHDTAQLFVFGGASASIRNLTINGSTVRVGFDGQSGTASLTVTETLHFVDAPTIQERRSGDFGLEEIDTAATGQPRDPNVQSELILGSGCTVSIDATNLPAGQYQLIQVDNLIDAGATLPPNVSIQQNTLTLSVS